MSIIINGTTLGSDAYFGNTKLQTINFNNTKVWEAKPPTLSFDVSSYKIAGSTYGNNSSVFFPSNGGKVNWQSYTKTSIDYDIYTHILVYGTYEGYNSSQYITYLVNNNNGARVSFQLNTNGTMFVDVPAKDLLPSSTAVWRGYFAIQAGYWGSGQISFKVTKVEFKAV